LRAIGSLRIYYAFTGNRLAQQEPLFSFCTFMQYLT
jgi:hypothetical protein